MDQQFSPSSLQRERSQSRDWFMLGCVGLALISIGWFAERKFEQYVTLQVDVALAKATKRLGMPLQIGTKELHPTSLLLTGLAIGEGQPIIIDRVEIGIGWNPFSPGFLRPSRVDVGRVLVKEQVKRGERINWALKWKDLLGKRKSGNQTGAVSAALVPPELHLEAVKVILADGTDEHTVLEGLSANVQLVQKRLTWEADRVLLKPNIDEEHLAGRITVGDDGELQWVVRQRSDLMKKSDWLATCEKTKGQNDVVCDIDAVKIPKSVLRPFAKVLNPAAERPGFHGSVRLSSKKNDILTATVDGDLTGIFATHKTLSIDQIGPFSLGSRFTLTFDRKTKRLYGKGMKFGVAPETSNERSIGLEVDMDVRKGDDANGMPVAGDIRVNLPRTRCDDFLNALPPGFAPDIQGFSLTGDLAFEAFVRLNDGDIGFRWGNTMLGCQVAKVPPSYSGEYLSGAFELERTMNDGQVVHIPVDPSRPEYAALNTIPGSIVSAFVSSEDAGFWQHHGVEPNAIVQALERNAKEGRAAVGGSTITMQTVKNLFLSRDKNISRKAQEIFLAWYLEQTLSKQRILEIYLNIVEFGPGLYGIGNASKLFFGVPPSQLTLKQGIYLASLLPAPIPRFQYFCKGYLTDNYKRLVGTLLQRMYSLNRISAAAYAAAEAEPVLFQSQNDSRCQKPSGLVVPEAQANEDHDE